MIMKTFTYSVCQQLSYPLGKKKIQADGALEFHNYLLVRPIAWHIESHT